MSQISAPADKRFRRAQVSPAKKRPWTSWRVIAMLSLALGAAGGGAYWLVTAVLGAEALTVTRITVSGNERLSRGEVLALLEDVVGQSMVAADLEGWKQRLLSSPWVADAALRRVLPGTLSVAISERAPIGIARVGDSLYLIDDRGLTIDEFGPNYADFDLPIIDGLAAPTQSGGLLIDESRAALAARLLADLRSDSALASRVSEIDVTDVRDAAVILKGDTALVRLGGERFAERLQSYLDLAPALRERVPDIDYVDLRFDERVYVKPQKAPASRLQTAGTGGGGE
jgi:cell division protein FtsQ